MPRWVKLCLVSMILTANAVGGGNHDGTSHDDTSLDDEANIDYCTQEEMERAVERAAVRKERRMQRMLIGTGTEAEDHTGGDEETTSSSSSSFSQSVTPESARVGHEPRVEERIEETVRMALYWAAVFCPDKEEEIVDGERVRKGQEGSGFNRKFDCPREEETALVTRFRALLRQTSQKEQQLGKSLDALRMSVVLCRLMAAWPAPKFRILQGALSWARDTQSVDSIQIEIQDAMRTGNEELVEMLRALMQSTGRRRRSYVPPMPPSPWVHVRRRRRTHSHLNSANSNYRRKRNLESMMGIKKVKSEDSSQEDRHLKTQGETRRPLRKGKALQSEVQHWRRPVTADKVGLQLQEDKIGNDGWEEMIWESQGKTWAGDKKDSSGIPWARWIGKFNLGVLMSLVAIKLQPGKSWAISAVWIALNWMAVEVWAAPKKEPKAIWAERNCLECAMRCNLSCSECWRPVCANCITVHKCGGHSGHLSPLERTVILYANLQQSMPEMQTEQNLRDSTLRALPKAHPAEVVWITDWLVQRIAICFQPPGGSEAVSHRHWFYKGTPLDVIRQYFARIYRLPPARLTVEVNPTSLGDHAYYRAYLEHEDGVDIAPESLAILHPLPLYIPTLANLPGNPAFNVDGLHGSPWDALEEHRWGMASVRGVPLAPEMRHTGAMSSIGPSSSSGGAGTLVSCKTIQERALRQCVQESILAGDPVNVPIALGGSHRLAGVTVQINNPPEKNSSMTTFELWQKMQLDNVDVTNEILVLDFDGEAEIQPIPSTEGLIRHTVAVRRRRRVRRRRTAAGGLTTPSPRRRRRRRRHSNPRDWHYSNLNSGRTDESSGSTGGSGSRSSRHTEDYQMGRTDEYKGFNGPITSSSRSCSYVILQMPLLLEGLEVDSCATPWSGGHGENSWTRTHQQKGSTRKTAADLWNYWLPPIGANFADRFVGPADDAKMPSAGNAGPAQSRLQLLRASGGQDTCTVQARQRSDLEAVGHARGRGYAAQVRDVGVAAPCVEAATDSTTGAGACKQRNARNTVSHLRRTGPGDSWADRCASAER
jgi:hypothetical protein